MNPKVHNWALSQLIVIHLPANCFHCTVGHDCFRGHSAERQTDVVDNFRAGTKSDFHPGVHNRDVVLPSLCLFEAEEIFILNSIF